jgi:rod shape determining protein RodA
MPIPQITTLLKHDDTRGRNRGRGIHGASHAGRTRRDKIASFFNVPFLLVCLVVIVFGLIVCWSAVSVDEDYSFSRQLGGIAVGLVVMCALWAYDYRKLSGMAIPFLIISVLLILSPHLPVIGVTTMGATSWIKIGIQVQPGEFAKVTVVLFAASLLSRYGGKLDSLTEYIKVVLLLLCPFLAIMTQPDLGTGLVYLFISAVVLVMGGARLKYLIWTVVLGIAAIAAVFAIDELLKYPTSDGTYEYVLLKQYQRSRLFVFMNQDSLSTTDDGYNLQQAMIAIGSGGLLGKGLGAGAQSALGFLPEAPTDFIFCVLAEDLGFVGVVFLLVLYLALLIICIGIAKKSSSLFGMLIVCAIVGMWIFQILENIGMCCGLMPITGIPLPFVSYGSSFMVVNFAMLGLIASVHAHESGIGKGVRYATSS